MSEDNDIPPRIKITQATLPYLNPNATPRYNVQEGRYTVEFNGHVVIPAWVKEVQGTLPEGCVLEYQGQDDMWHVVQEVPYTQTVSERVLKTMEEQYKIWKEEKSTYERLQDSWEKLKREQDYDDAMRKAQDELNRYAAPQSGTNGYIIAIDEARNVHSVPLHDFTFDASVASPVGQQGALPIQTPNWPTILPEASESPLRASQGHCGDDLAVRIQVGNVEYISELREMIPKPLNFAGAIRALQTDAGATYQDTERISRGIEGLAKRREMFPSVPLVEAIDALDDDPDDSGNRVEFLKSLAAYMLDNNIELSGLQVALEYEIEDRVQLEMAAEKAREAKEYNEQGPVVEDDYYDKVWE